MTRRKTLFLESAAHKENWMGNDNKTEEFVHNKIYLFYEQFFFLNVHLTLSVLII